VSPGRAKSRRRQSRRAFRRSTRLSPPRRTLRWAFRNRTQTHPAGRRRRQATGRSRCCLLARCHPPQRRVLRGRTRVSCCLWVPRRLPRRWRVCRRHRRARGRAWRVASRCWHRPTTRGRVRRRDRAFPVARAVRAGVSSQSRSTTRRPDGSPGRASRAEVSRGLQGRRHRDTGRCR